MNVGQKRSWRRIKKKGYQIFYTLHTFLNGPSILSVDYTEMTFISFFRFFSSLKFCLIRSVHLWQWIIQPPIQWAYAKRMNRARSNCFLTSVTRNTCKHTMSNSDSSKLILCVYCVRLLMCSAVSRFISKLSTPLVVCLCVSIWAGILSSPCHIVYAKVNLLFRENVKEISMFKWHRDGGEDINTLYFSFSISQSHCVFSRPSISIWHWYDFHSLSIRLPTYHWLL